MLQHAKWLLLVGEGEALSLSVCLGVGVGGGGEWMDSAQSPPAALQRALSEGAAIGTSGERCAPAPQSCFVKSICTGNGVILHRLACVS